MIGKIVRCEDIHAATKAAMHELFSRQFDGVPLDVFVDDLNEKNWVLLLRNAEDVLTGFSSIHYYEKSIGDKTYPVVFSGDTVVDVTTWSDSALSYWWMGAVDYLRRLHKKDCLYWFLLVSGYRTYRFLPVYSEHYFPRCDRPTPDAIQSVMHGLAQDRFGDRYDSATGIVRLRRPAVLKHDLNGIPQNRMSDPNIAFFAERNPAHARGDELVCFAELSKDRLSRLGKRMWRKGRKLVEDSGNVF